MKTGERGRSVPRTGRRTVALMLALGFLGCGEETVRRPLALDIRNLSAQAETLVITILPGGNAPACTQVNSANATAFSGIQLGWTRSSQEPRSFDVDNIDTENVTVIAYSLDATGRLLQLACVEIRYFEIESPEVEVFLETQNR